MSDLNDRELFEQAIADTPAEPVQETPAQEPETEAARQERERDERGRFVAKAEETPTETVQTPEPAPKQETEAHVPSWRLREVSEEKSALQQRLSESDTRLAEMQRQLMTMQQQLQATQKTQEPVDWYADPNAAIRQTIDPVKSEFQNALEGMKAQFSEMMARQAVGDAKFEEVKKWAMTRVNDPALSARVDRSPHPYGELIKSYDEQKTLSEIGGDINAFRSKILDEALKDPNFMAKALEAAKAQASGQLPGTKPNTTVQLPPSINRATSAASPHDEVGDLSNQSLYAAATR